MNNEQKLFTIGIGGQAGDGIREAGLHLVDILHRIGYYTFLSFDHPSLIRGGHNYSRISFSKEKVWCDHTEIDILIAVNSETVRLHSDEVKKDGIVMIESAFLGEIKNTSGNILSIPFSATATALQARPIARTSVALGAFSFIAGIPFEKTKELVREVFHGPTMEMNLSLAEKGYQFAEEKNMQKWDGGLSIESRTDTSEVFDGNQGIGKGFVDAGLNFFISYPMTPATTILHYLAKEAIIREELKTIQPEDEISAINMAIGVAYSGKRVAVGTATGGFALMQEAFSFAGISETPVVVAVSQRQAPATGVPTNTSQGDLQFILHSGHGEFPRIIIAPGDTEESYYAGANALELVWKYQMPAIVLLDKHISESAQTALLEPSKIVREETKRWADDGKLYQRYSFTDDGISPLAFPGTKNAVVKLTSYEHEESGIGTESPEMVVKMQDKRFRKIEKLVEDLGKYETVKIYGDKNSDVSVVFWGSTKGAVLEASKYFNKPIKLVQILWMEPFDTVRVGSEIGNSRIVINVEGNHNAQLASLIREKTGILIKQNILQYNSKPFDPVELAAKINALIA